MLTLVTYWQIQDHDFINFDDYEYVVNNPHVRSGPSAQGVLWAFGSFHAGNWHPLTWLSHMVDAYLYGLNPKGHHLNSLILHMANTLLLFFLLKAITSALWRSALVAALFSIHPLHVESVAWVAERKDLLCTLFWLLTMMAYARYVKRPAPVRYLAALVLFALALMAKPMAVTLPFVLLLLDSWPLARIPGRDISNVDGLARNQVSHRAHGEHGDNIIKMSYLSWCPLCLCVRNESSHDSVNVAKGGILVRLVLEKIPFFVLSGISVFITIQAQEASGAVKSFIPLMDRLANALFSYGTYIVKAVWPHPLSIYYPHPLVSLPLWQWAGSLLLLLGISIAVARIRNRYPFLLAGWLWYLGTLVPVIGLVQVGTQGMADRYTYIPFIGLFLMLAWGLGRIGSRKSSLKTATAVFSALLVCALSLKTSIHLRHWKNGITLFEHAIRVNPDNLLAHNNLGNAYARQGRLDEAAQHLTEALRLRPDYAPAHTNLGNVLMAQGRIKEAIESYAMAIKIDPSQKEAQYNLGIALQKASGENNDGLAKSRHPGARPPQSTLRPAAGGTTEDG